MDISKFRGRYLARGYSQQTLSKAMGYKTAATLSRKCKEETLTVKDVDKLIALLNLAPQDISDIFFPKGD